MNTILSIIGMLGTIILVGVFCTFFIVGNLFGKEEEKGILKNGKM